MLFRLSIFSYALLVASIGLTVYLLANGGGALYFGPLDSDLTNTFHPWRSFVHRWFSRGVFPFWDPHTFNGYPVVESQQMATLNPAALIAALLFSPMSSLIAQTIFHTVLAAGGMVFALRKCFRLCHAASALGGVLYAFSSVFSIRVAAGHFTVVTAMAWWPLALGFSVAACRKLPGFSACRPDVPFIKRGLIISWSDGLTLINGPGRWLLPGAAVSNAMVCVAGAPQYVVYLFWVQLVACLAVCRAKIRFRALLPLGISWGLALMLSAPQWLPALAYLPHSARAGGSGIGQSSGMDRFNLLLELLLPFPFGDDLRQPHLHMKNVWETSTYPGTLALILTAWLLLRGMAAFAMLLITAVKTRAWPTARAGINLRLTAADRVGLACLLLSVYVIWGGWLPGFAGFREPLKIRAVLALGLAISAAAQFDWMVRRWSKINRRTLLYDLAGLLACMVIAGLSFAAYQYGANPRRFLALIKDFGFPFDPGATAFYNRVLQDPRIGMARYVSAAQLVMALSATAALLIALRNRYPSVALAGLLLTGAADPVWNHAYAFYSRHPIADAELPPALREFISPRIAESASGGEAPWRIYLHSSIINRTHYLDGFYETGGYDPLMPKNANNRVMLMRSAGAEVDRQTILPFLRRAVGVRYDISAWNPTDGEAITSASLLPMEPDASMISIERSVDVAAPALMGFGPDINNRHFVVPAFLGGVEDPDLESVSDEFRRRVDAIQPLPDGRPDGYGLAPGETLTMHPRTRPDTYSFDVNLRTPALVLLRTTWLPGWQVQQESGGFEMASCANHWMVATLAPAGNSTITFRYRPAYWKTSLALTLAGLALLMGLIINPRARTKKQKL